MLSFSSADEGDPGGLICWILGDDQAILNHNLSFSTVFQYFGTDYFLAAVGHDGHYIGYCVALQLLHVFVAYRACACDDRNVFLTIGGQRAVEA